MRTMLLTLALAISTNIHARDSLLDEVVNDTVEKCRREKSFFHLYKTYDSNGKYCVFYQCVGDYKDSLKVGKDRVKTEGRGHVMSGQVCVTERKEHAYLISEFEQLKNVDAFLCYKSCAKTSAVNDCRKCHDDYAKLNNCKISTDFKSLKCPQVSYDLGNDLNQSLKELIQR